MDTNIISPTCQEFNGMRFYLSNGKPYFIRAWEVKGKHFMRYLHHVVWEFHNGPIPTPRKNWHVHHKDGDRSNNQISNLALMDRAEHLRNHMTSARRAWARKNMIENAVPAARAWHSTPAGNKFHLQNGYKSSAKSMSVPKKGVCVVCGKDFERRCIQKRLLYCSLRCCWKHWGRIKRAKLKAARLASSAKSTSAPQ